MDSVHGVDVSWLHRPHLGKENRTRSTSSPTVALTQSEGTAQASTSRSPAKADQPVRERITVATNLASAPSLPLDNDPTPPSPHSESPGGKPKRPSLRGRGSSDRVTSADGKTGRKGSWMSSISSKFSSQPNTPSTPEPVPEASPKHPKPPSPGSRADADEHPYVPQKPKESGASFFSSISRRLSSNSPSTPGTKTSPGGTVCARMVLNVDHNRQRCLLPDFKAKTLRKVAFSVDVEIAAQPRYKVDAPTISTTDPAATSNSDIIEKAEAAEGAALKQPNTALEDPTIITDKDPLQQSLGPTSEAPQLEAPQPEAPQTSHKKEKKKKAEDERRERKEMKRQKAEDSGSVPVEFTQETDAPGPARARASSNVNKIRPTTDPVRIYRRCCQLRESPILKRITEQLMSPTCVVAGSQGTVALLDLTGSRMQPADVVTLADWLAVVPVKRLVIDDSDLDDESLRVVLAGLLAAQTPQHSKCLQTKTSGEPRAQLGIVEKLSLKNNPRITAVGWHHVSLFLYMCRSIKAIDMSMVPFPKSNASEISTPDDTAKATVEVLCKAVSERLAGPVLEEIILSECGLDAHSVQRLTDAMITCGISRLGLAGVELNDQAFECVLTYIRSDVCNALDLGSNDLTGKVQRLSEALGHSSRSKLWGLSLASCNLDPHGLDMLLSSIEKLENFKFIDLSHNTGLCQVEIPRDGIQVLRDYIPRLRQLKRLHLLDVGMDVQQAIALAEILPESPSLAHVSLLENEALSASIAKTDQTSQQESCALFASLMAAVKVSSTIVCLDIDVPPRENCEVIKGMAQQVVAYCLRNMSDFPIGDQETAVGTVAQPQDISTKPLEVPEVLLHLVGPDEPDKEVSVPDEDYIVGGTGLVKALQYCLVEKAKDAQLEEATLAPHGKDLAKKGKVREMSKGLLDSARQMRARLQPQLVKEAACGDEMSYRRLQFLDSTLSGMILRFEDEYPETRLSTPVSTIMSSVGSLGSQDSTQLERMDDAKGGLSALTAPDDDRTVVKQLGRTTSEVSLASKVLSQEEGRLHRLSSNIRRDIFAASPSRRASTPPAAGDEDNLTNKGPPPEDSYFRDLRQRIEGMSGQELKDLVDSAGFDGALEHVGANVEDLRALHEADPIAWEQFKESQLMARMNLKT